MTGRTAYRLARIRDIPDAEVRFLDTGYFILETHYEVIAAPMRASSAGNSPPELASGGRPREGDPARFRSWIGP